MDTQTQIDRLIELAIVQRTDLKKLVSELPQLREHLSAEIERTFDEFEPQLRTELEEFCATRADDKHAKLSAELSAKIESFSRSLQDSAQAKFSALLREREENVRVAKEAEDKIAEHAASLPSAVKEIVEAELSRFPRAGEIDQLRKEFQEPRGLNPRGKWTAGEVYNKLDLVAYNGDSFVSNTNGNRERPNRSSDAWTLNAARGNAGGGGGISSLTDILPIPSSGQILGSEGPNYTPKTLVAGANITITETPTQITITGDEGQIELQDGTAAAPSLFFVNDVDTGLFRPGTNLLGVAAGGQAAITIGATEMTLNVTDVKLGGDLSIDNDTLYIDKANSRVGIGTSTPAASLAVRSQGSTNTRSVLVEHVDNTTAFSQAKFIGARSRGSHGSPSAVLANDSLASFNGQGYKTSAWSNTVGGFYVYAAENWTNTATGSFAAFRLAATGGTTVSEVARLTSTGNFLVGGTSDILGGGGLKVFGTTASTSTTTGALQVAGGAGIAGALFTGGGVTAQSLLISTDSQGSVISSSGNTLFIDSSAGAIQVRPKAGSSFTIGNSVPLVANAATFSGAVTASTLTGPASTNLTLAGGSSGASLVLGQGASGIATLTGGSAKLLLGTTTDSANGRLQLATHTTSAGGIGFGTDTSLFRAAAGILAIDGTSTAFAKLRLLETGSLKFQLESVAGDVTLATLTAGKTIKFNSGNDTLALTLDSSQNATFAKNVTLGETLQISRLVSGNVMDVNFYNPFTGPGVVAKIRGDGDGVENGRGAISFHTVATSGGTLTERVRIKPSGDFSIASTTASSSTTTGALTVAGGVGVAGALFTGGNVVTTGEQAIVRNSFATFKLTQSTGGTAYRWTLNNDNNIRLQHSTDDFATVNNTRLLVDSSGNLTVNTGSITAAASTNLTLAGGSSGASLVLGQGASGIATLTGGSAKLLLGTTTDSANGRLQLATHTTSAGGIGFGTDAAMHRYGVGRIALDATSGTVTALELRQAGVAAGYFYQSALTCILGTSGAFPLLLQTNGTTALTLDSSQNATFAGKITAAGVFDFSVNANSTQVFTIQNGSTGAAARTRLTFVGGASSANIELFGSGHTTPNIVQYASPASHKFLCNGVARLDLDVSGNLTTGGAVTTSAPTGGAGAWELGVANTVTPTAPNRTITIEIGGTVYYLHAKTTND